MSELVISFLPSGVTQSLHMDAFPLSFLGDMSVERQTDIPFDAATQSWGIQYITPTGERVSDPVLLRFDTYDHARGFEVLWLNECRFLGVVPTSEEGLDIAVDLRVGYAA